VSELPGIIYTLGSSTRSPEEFLGLLEAFAIQLVIDVRRFPTSRFEHFRRENLAALLGEKGIGYLYLGTELGGYRSGGYESFMASEQFRDGLERLEEAAEARKVVILCSERLPWRCHRRFIGRQLLQRGWRVSHVIDDKRSWEPKLQAAAE
jgi:uncharacterized protein (DUF488 family)